jgi:hypothetical protein
VYATSACNKKARSGEMTVTNADPRGEVFEIYRRNGNRRFVDQDGQNPRLKALALQYAVSYNGTFEWMRGVQRALAGQITAQTARGVLMEQCTINLSAPQVRGVLNTMVREFAGPQQKVRLAPRGPRRQMQVRTGMGTFETNGPVTSSRWTEEQRKRELATQQKAAEYARQEAERRAREDAERQQFSVEFSVRENFPDGTYTVILSNDNDYVTLRVQKLDLGDCRKYRIPDGTRIISYLNGPDNGKNFKKMGWMDGSYVFLRDAGPSAERRQRAMRILVLADEITLGDYGEGYAKRSQRCCKCLKKLTVPASLHRGQGPICWQRYGGIEKPLLSRFRKLTEEEPQLEEQEYPS